MRRMAAVLLILASPVLADSNLPPAPWANRQLPDERQEAQATALMHEIRCLVCQGQSVADSDAELAGDMRNLIRTRIAAGEKPAAVRQWPVDRYGNWISFNPPATPIGWPLWAAPILLLAAGLIIVRHRFKLRSAP